MSTKTNLLRRLFAKDTTLWTSDAEISAAIQQRLGWLDAISFSLTQTQRLSRLREQARAEGFDHAILLGMGGSSLAPEVFARCFTAQGDIDLIVLDTTFPDTIHQTTAGAEGGKPLFIVSSKSGTTAETEALRQHFWQWSQTRYGSTSNNHFIAITDEHSSLHRLAVEHDYREIFLNPADIGGRYSALSLFGLVPASLLGIDVERLLHDARSIFSAGPGAEHALALGVGIGNAAVAGRNKLTLTFSHQLKPLGPWIEQLVAESTGKEGKGIIPIIDEPTIAAGQYGPDRLFVDVSLLANTEDRARDDWQRELKKLGHPVFTEQIKDIYELGAEFAKWQIATAIASAVMQVNPFDEPDVNATKAATSRLLEQPAESPEPGAAIAGATDVQISSVQHFLEEADVTDYVAVLAYLPAGAACDDALAKLRQGITRRSGCATCVALGPRYLHSSGQLHKGGPKNGHFIFLTASPALDLAIPAQNYGFKHLIKAQANADMAVLRRRGQQVLHIELGSVATAVATICSLADGLGS